MRFLTGLAVGIMLTIGAAYITDVMHAAPGPDARSAPQMVNWTVVNDNLRGLSTDVQDGWNRLVSATKQIDKKSGI
jgi:hypothetical protein